jgi:spore coat protein H
MLHAIESAKGDEIQKVIKTYFDRENYTTWMAVNFVTANQDTISQNFFLYNPKGSKKFYFIPWDYDDASNYKPEQLPKWHKGWGLYWQVLLHKKFLAIEENRDEVKRKIREIYQRYINPQTVAARLNLYRPVVERAVTTPPDSQYLNYGTWSDDFLSLPGEIETNVRLFEAEEGAPMPFWQAAQRENGRLVLVWDRSYSFKGASLVYDVWVADNPDGVNPLFFRQGLDNVDLDIKEENIYLDTGLVLRPGTYYMKVVAREKENPMSYQIAFDSIQIGDKQYFGVLRFVIE